MVSALLAVGLSCCLVYADGLTNNQSNITVVRHGSYVYTWIWTNNRVIYMNPSEFWPGTWKEDTNGWRVQLCIYPEANYWYPKEGAGHPISTNLMLSVDWGSVTKSSLDGHYYRPPNGKFAKFELLDAKGNVISSNPNAGSNLLIKLSGGTYGTNLPTWVSPASGSLVAKFQKTISTNVYPQDQYSGMVGEIGAATNMPPFYVGLLKLDEIYSVTNEGDYTLTVQPVLYKRSNTNQAILNRVDLPSVTTKVHLVPNVK